MQAQNVPSTGLLADYLSRDALARELNITVRTLARWHWQRIGPPSVMLGGRRLYRRADVARWIEQQTDGAAA